MYVCGCVGAYVRKYALEQNCITNGIIKEIIILWYPRKMHDPLIVSPREATSTYVLMQVRVNVDCEFIATVGIDIDIDL